MPSVTFSVLRNQVSIYNREKEDLYLTECKVMEAEPQNTEVELKKMPEFYDQERILRSNYQSIFLTAKESYKITKNISNCSIELKLKNKKQISYTYCIEISNNPIYGMRFEHRHAEKNKKYPISNAKRFSKLLDTIIKKQAKRSTSIISGFFR